ncbi:MULTISPECIES: hypothetical protein [unclassified Microcoleus]|uniref:hypothetical protein n=1 Tax=unclassified Microcoleus TaxID=2642155 RepID=UPI0025CFD553|nr:MULTISPECIES: hypothetical protein [unclassified Microcoleus]
MNTPETTNSWIIYRLLPNFQRLPIGQFRSRSEAESSLKVIRQLLPNTELILAFEIGTENPTTELIGRPAKEPNLPNSVNRELLKLFIISSRPVVSRVIHSFHRDNFACATDWSPFVPTQNRGEVMSVLIKYFAADC